MKEQRLNFSDYPASEQERDAQKAKKLLKHAYLMRVDGEWAHFIVTQRGDDYKFYGDKMNTPSQNQEQHLSGIASNS